MTALKLKPRHKWFAGTSREDIEEWTGPWATIDLALYAAATEDVQVFYVAQGRRTTKAEREEWAVDYEWQIESSHAIEIRLPE